MATKIQFIEIGKYSQGQVEKLVKAAVLETDALVKQSSPVKTGRFRYSWQVGENSASGPGAAPGRYPNTPRIRRTNYSEEKVGRIYSVHNNLPYAEALAGGSYPPSWGGQYRSNQAEPGWLQSIAKDVQTRVTAAAARIGRDS